jgi:hypothetical protein
MLFAERPFAVAPTVMMFFAFPMLEIVPGPGPALPAAKRIT